MASDPIAVASDHGGFELKTLVITDLKAAGVPVLDLGTMSSDSVDYPDYADALARALAEGKARRGVLLCGTGIGVSMAANRHKGIRAAVCRDVTDARLARQHNDANVLCLGGRTTGPEVARDILRTFLSTDFEGGGRHTRRIAKFS
ncbi:MAG TPA: ribose 5-phosphate isomerase B [Alphaproteobacteria bacterium]|nr:ribose 5-phosphate isomerase B [Alphaproteobacteria bacterium]